MLHIAPDVPYTQSFLLYTPITDLEPTGVWGHAAQATAEKGRRHYEQLVTASVEAIEETFAALERIRRGPGRTSRTGPTPP
jgi:creatinine amidohydrolase/Fe(II)-dependent formamide hydrolase-like protein